MFDKLVVVGNVGGDPTMQFTPNGNAYTRFSVAVNHRWTGQDGQSNEITTWYQVTAWGKQAEACNDHLVKGKLVLVEGRLSPDKETGGPRVWEKNDGSSGASYEVRAQTVRFLSRGSEGNGQHQTPEEVLAEEDIPF